jgi:hypothetical protein
MMRRVASQSSHFVAKPANGLDQRAAGSQLAADRLDVRIDGSIQRISVPFADGRGNLLAACHRASPCDEELKNAKLSCRKHDWLAGVSDDVASRINKQLSMRNRSFLRR